MEPQFNSTYYSLVYREFKSIDPGAYREIIRFFEQREASLARLDFGDFFEVLVAYVDALFEIGAYRKHLAVVDVVIEQSIAHNIVLYQGRDIYGRMLFRKAAALFHIQEYSKATYILSELRKLDATDAAYAGLYRKCRLRARPVLLNRTRATSVFLFMFTALLIALEILLVRPWYALQVPLVVALRNTTFVAGCLLLLAGFGYNYYLANRDMSRWQDGLIRDQC